MGRHWLADAQSTVSEVDLGRDRVPLHECRWSRDRTVSPPVVASVVFDQAYEGDVVPPGRSRVPAGRVRPLRNGVDDDGIRERGRQTEHGRDRRSREKEGVYKRGAACRRKGKRKKKVSKTQIDRDFRRGRRRLERSPAFVVSSLLLCLLLPEGLPRWCTCTRPSRIESCGLRRTKKQRSAFSSSGGMCLLSTGPKL